jgi:L-lactate dehydrogenase complex protein LldG
MNSSKDQILARIRAASPAADRAGADAAYAALPRAYLRAHHDPAAHDTAELFAERTADYRAIVERARQPDLAKAIARVLGDRAAAEPGAIVVPEGLPAGWLAELPAGITLAADDPPLAAAELDQMAGVVTGCAAAIAETGTIILDHGPGQGRRALTLVPDFHLVIVQAGQIAADLADAFERLDPSRPHTLISGPSATSDIELIRVEGVHGPRILHVILAGLTGYGPDWSPLAFLCWLCAYLAPAYSCVFRFHGRFRGDLAQPHRVLGCFWIAFYWLFREISVKGRTERRRCQFGSGYPWGGGHHRWLEPACAAAWWLAWATNSAAAAVNRSPRRERLRGPPRRGRCSRPLRLRAAGSGRTATAMCGVALAGRRGTVARSLRMRGRDCARRTGST